MSTHRRAYRGTIPSLLSLLLILTACSDDARSPVGPSPDPALAVTAAALSFFQVSAGDVHSCGLTTDQRAYCWGDSQDGKLGTGSEDGPETCQSAVGPFSCSTRPVAVTGTRPYRQISASNAHTCAVGLDRQAYCWGRNSFGSLGTGSETSRLAPTPVQGGLRFYQVEAGLWHTCGVSYPDRQAYCWGYNEFGQLGDGTRTDRLTPVAVAGNRRFRQVSAADWHTCGVTTSNEAYCWGRDNVGQLGNDDVKGNRTKPVRVAGGLAWRQLDAGGSHTCAVTTGDHGYCWGGTAIGDGRTRTRFTPSAVAGGLLFSRVVAGTFHTCGETTTNRAYCWGNNGRGQLGNGGPVGTEQLRPVPVAGDLRFAQLSASSTHTCGKTTGSVAYCWGYGFFGQLGDGSSGFGAETSSPVAVLGPS